MSKTKAVLVNAPSERSQHDPLSPYKNDLYASLLTRTAVAASCMDLNPDRSREYQQGRLRYQQSSPTLHQASVRQPGPPIPHPVPQQRQWEDVPLPYRPREWRDPSEATQRESVPEPLFAWRLRPRPDQPSRRTDPARQHPRPRALRNLFSRNEYQEQAGSHGVDPSLLYPQMSPYNDQASSLSAPDQLEHFPRSVSQPNTPSRWPPPEGDEVDELPLALMPRSPTYPPATSSRLRGHVNVTDTTFTDEEEFSLFVQATAGIMPPDMGPPMPRNARRATIDETGHLQSPVSERLVSPLQETPTTMQALQQLAQLPHSSLSPVQQRDPRLPQVPTRSLTADQAAMAGVDLWIEPPTPSYDDDDDISPIDEELPDYASSQQQAQAAQRAEASRRAQELQRQWRESQGNY
ncbi:hypothetical protein PRZ48_001093 [Zasmidium cellare]|uniref:Uncharacterized protein n=1 Tax=Zasmidium cellare TaxID=395010 RepID=A0ABR0F200_ZASCE|nr:hypothetical protein PRZ48_001093 [Zasmidium cellare]